ncbi:hypothetical protein AMTRI_Chr08g168260 [Amborella trichopoda]|uniref:Transcription elongation factor n=1 Tax=Amborella trichopoda TaxID=13333 RepID=W1PB17_AMBTC|nr:transcription elongation factor TFIIS [Amborella trichopoda]ERN04195.1 hypothetical protein AMTR_s00077p00115030 [Amborella trichopoda]|eukprot:XP_006842520.1 transcription elongation factor TFIIS [Amborella trichopoda]
MAGKSMETELLKLFDKAKKAADLAAFDQGSVQTEEARCLDTLKLMKDFPVSTSILVSTQVGKRLRPLTKHPRAKIQAVASDVLDIWKNLVIKETSKNNKTNNKSDEKNSIRVEVKSINSGSKGENVKIEMSPNASVNVEKVPKVESIKVEKVEKTTSVRVEKIAKEEREPKKASSSFAPPKLSGMIKCNDSLRDKYRELLAEAFSKVSSETDEAMMEEVNACDPIRVAVTVESVMFEKMGRSNGAQKYKYRSILFNLKDANNPDLRRRVLLGKIKPENLINMTPEEMASDQRKRENNQIKEKALFECQREGAPKATTDQFRCGRCGQRKTTYHQLQTRSADEPMTTFVTCVNCNNHWKFC